MNAIKSLPYFGSEIIIVAAVFIALVLDFFLSEKKWVGYFCLLALFVAWVTSVAPHGTLRLFFGYFTLDPFTHFFRFVIYLAVVFAIIASLSYKLIAEKYKGEFYVLLLALAVLLTLMAGATNLLMIFLAIESVSLTSYLLAGFQKFGKRSSEAALKYVLFGAVSTALMLFGISLIFGITGEIDMVRIASKIRLGGSALHPIMITGMLFLFTGIGFKISMAPFHMWAPDVYQGAPTPVAAFLTVAPKALGFAIFARVLFYAFPAFQANWAPLLGWLAIITMTFGNILAVSQFDMKRLLAYSSIAQAGYILVGLAVPGSTLGLQAVLIYAVTYLFTNMGAFFTVLIIEQNLGVNDIGAYAGLSKRSPLLALCMTLFLLSLAGIPPFAGFIGKVYIFAAAVEGKAIALAVVVALNSAVAAYYYFKVVRSMYLTEGETNEPFTHPLPAKIAVGITLAGVILIGLFPASLIRFVETSVALFPSF
jgi:NADH-quinone oxidoreductase subunit N